jgi:hypothetical protein
MSLKENAKLWEINKGIKIGTELNAGDINIIRSHLKLAYDNTVNVAAY